MREESERWFNLRDSADKIGISVASLRRHINAGRVTTARMDRASWVLPESSLEEYLSTGTFGPREWLWTGEVAQMIGLGPEAVRRMALAGTWEVTLCGGAGRLRIRRASVERWMKGLRPEGEPAS